MSNITSVSRDPLARHRIVRNPSRRPTLGRNVDVPPGGQQVLRSSDTWAYCQNKIQSKKNALERTHRARAAGMVGTLDTPYTRGARHAARANTVRLPTDRPRRPVTVAVVLGSIRRTILAHRIVQTAHERRHCLGLRKQTKKDPLATSLLCTALRCNQHPGHPLLYTEANSQSAHANWHATFPTWALQNRYTHRLGPLSMEAGKLLRYATNDLPGWAGVSSALREVSA